MADENIIAAFDKMSDADSAVRDLEAAGVPSTSITKHASETATGGAAMPARKEGFWSSLFGAEPEHDTAVYDRSIESGGVVVSVRTPEAHVTRVTEILERYHPVDLNERASTYGLRGTGAATDTTMGTTGAARVAPGARTDMAAGVGTGVATGVAGGVARGVEAGGTERLSLSEEQLAVGKRAVNRGTTRIHRFVVETPVEESVTLRDETVSIERHAVEGGRAVTDADFSDKTIEVTETDEEAVVSKTARVREEVVINKAATERTETVRDTVRREDVKIDKDGGTAREVETTGASRPRV